jgi:hypothetical protein
MKILINNTNFTQVSGLATTQGVIGTVLGSLSSNVTIETSRFIGGSPGIVGNSSLTVTGGVLYVGSTNVFDTNNCVFQNISELTDKEHYI